ncbi:MAG: hypothetical protein WA277_02890 [Nitrospirota bacterium]
MIIELTEEQRKMIPVYVEKWAKVGLSTEPIKDYEETINLFYEKVLNKKRPAKIILAPSPLQAWEQLYEQVEKQGRKPVWERLQEQVRVWEELEKQVKKQVGQRVIGQVDRQVSQQIWERLMKLEQVWERLWNRGGLQVWERLVPQEWQVGKLFVDIRLGFGNCAFFDYLIQVLNIQYPENWPIYKRAAELSFYTLDDICIVSDRPEQVSMKNGFLHNETGMAVKCRDGRGIYMLNGVKVTKEIVETPADKLNPEILFKVGNVQVRREIVRKIGIERLEKKLKPRVLDKWGDYELHDYSNHFKRMRFRPVYLKMKNPSIGVWHYEGVNINEMEAPTCQAALKWRLNGLDFKPIQIT